jgi:hypothetical protein
MYKIMYNEIGRRVAGQVERDMAVSGVTAINPEVRPRPVVFNRTHVELPPNNPLGGYDRAETASYFGWLRDPRLPDEQRRFWFGAARQKLFQGFTIKL